MNTNQALAPIPDLEAIRQEHESWLGELEGLAVEAIASNDWTAFYAHLIDFQNEHNLHGESVIAIREEFDRVQPLDTEKGIEASTKSLSRSGADLLPNRPTD